MLKKDHDKQSLYFSSKHFTIVKLSDVHIRHSPQKKDPQIMLILKLILAIVFYHIIDHSTISHSEWGWGGGGWSRKVNL